MKQALEAVVVVAVLLLAALLFREARARYAVEPAPALAVGVTGDAPPAGTRPPVRAVQILPPIKTRSHPRVIEKSAPPPPPATGGG
jgi:hypothetical protein